MKFGRSSLRRGVREARAIARRAGERLQRSIQPRGLILVYHRVAEANSDPWALNVSPTHFCQHLEVLREYLRPVALAELEQARRTGRVPQGAVAVTFDDGYADNLHNAAPALERHDVPATIFVTSGALGAPRGFWWDELDLIILRTERLPPSLALATAGQHHSWETAEPGASREPADPAHPGRHHLYHALWEVLRELRTEERGQALENLRAWAGTASVVARPAHLPLSTQELVTLAEQPLIDIGAHTVSHAALATLPCAEQREEIHTSKARLEDVIARPVTSFAYPHGAYTPDTIEQVREAGFTCACSSRQAPVVHSSDAYQLPRIPVLDWDGERFARELSRWVPLRGRPRGRAPIFTRSVPGDGAIR